MCKTIDRVIACSIVCLMVVAMSACSGMGCDNDAVWLHGTWELTHNPDKDDSDILVFKDDGTVTVKTEDGREIPGKYLVDDNRLKMTLATARNVIDVEFTISQDKTKLLYQNGAFYTKRR